MLDYLKELSYKSFDIFCFTPGDSIHEVEINMLDYVDAGEKLDTNGMGDVYHIFTFRLDDKNEIYNFENFDAVLLSPLEYASTLIPQGWFGAFFRKTTTSEKTAKKLIDEIIN